MNKFFLIAKTSGARALYLRFDWLKSFDEKIFMENEKHNMDVLSFLEYEMMKKMDEILNKLCIPIEALLGYVFCNPDQFDNIVELKIDKE